MRIGVVILPDDDWAGVRGKFAEADARGFTTAWTYDHLSWRSLRDGPWLGTLPVLAAAAEATSSVRLGTLVTSPNFRHPAVLAKDAMTIDQISDGRLDLGIGAGGVGWDASVLGQPPLSPPERASRFEEFVGALDVLLREPAASVAGDFFTTVESRTLPGCIQSPRVPFTIAAAGPRALRVAASQGQRWVTYGPVAEEGGADEWYAGVAAQAERLDAACAEIDRDPASLDRMALVGLDLDWAQSSVDALDDFIGRVGELGFTDVAVHWPRPGDPALPGLPPAVFDELSARLA